MPPATPTETRRLILAGFSNTGIDSAESSGVMRTRSMVALASPSGSGGPPTLLGVFCVLGLKALISELLLLHLYLAVEI
jgi:hypothetical protein